MIDLADFFIQVRVGSDHGRDDDFIDNDLEVLWEAVLFSPARASCPGLGFRLLRLGALGRGWLAHDQLIEKQFELVGIELL